MKLHFSTKFNKNVIGLFFLMVSHSKQIIPLLATCFMIISCSAPVPVAEPLIPSTEVLATPTSSVVATESAAVSATDNKKVAKSGSGGTAQINGQTLELTVPNHTLDIILGEPGERSILFSFLANTDLDLVLEYWTVESRANQKRVQVTANEPAEYKVNDLVPNAQYFYRVLSTTESGSEPLEQGGFSTRKTAGSQFVFTIQADSHLDNNTNLDVYQQGLANQLNDRPDFMIDLGDTFMTDKYKPYTQALAQYQAQRYYLSALGKSVPLFLVLGNHDGEGAPRGQLGKEMNDWSVLQRTEYFPNPASASYHPLSNSAATNQIDHENYYAWTWGDAKFIVLDPYTYTPPVKASEGGGWNSTLGVEQYKWLVETLIQNDSKFTFVFIHQLVGGSGKDGRGGVEYANLYEWGGHDSDGQYLFDQFRPGWGLPIHELLVKHGVTAVFHGHDHLYVHEQLDGITYQEVPQPGSAEIDQTSSAAEYGYRNGEVLGGPGYMRVSVSPEAVIVEFVRTIIPTQNNRQKLVNRQVDDLYRLAKP